MRKDFIDDITIIRTDLVFRLCRRANHKVFNWKMTSDKATQTIHMFIHYSSPQTKAQTHRKMEPFIRNLIISS